MGISCIVFCNATNRTVIFGPNSNSVGRHLLNLVVADPQYQNIRFHVPGANGNVVIRSGQEDRRITLVARYIDTVANIKTASEDDKSEWAQASVEITDEAGQIFAGMNLVPNSFKELRRVTVAGPVTPLDGGCFAEFSFEFQQDAPL